MTPDADLTLQDAPARAEEVPPLQRAVYWLQYASMRLAMSLHFGMGEPMVRGLSKLSGRVGFRVDARHRKRAVTHLVSAGYSPRRARQITRHMFEHFISAFIEAMVLRRRLGLGNWQKYVRLENREVLDRAIEQGRGGIFVGCHQGSWELAGFVMNLLGCPLTTIARPFRNPYMHEFFNGARRSTGQRIIEQAGGVKELMRDVKSGRFGVILSDQDAGRSGVFVPFFGRPASTWPTAAAIAVKTGARLIPFYSYRERPFRYVFGAHPEPEPPRTGDYHADVRTLTAWYTKLLERSIRERPEQWLWAHRRWRTEPAGSPQDPVDAFPGVTAQAHP